MAKTIYFNITIQKVIMVLKKIKSIQKGIFLFTLMDCICLMKENGILNIILAIIANIWANKEMEFKYINV